MLKGVLLVEKPKNMKDFEDEKLKKEDEKKKKEKEESEEKSSSLRQSPK